MTFTPRFIVYLSLLFIIALYGVLNLKRLSTPFKLLSLLIGVTFFTESASRVFASKIKTSFPADHLYSIIEFILIAGIYYNLFKNLRMKRLLMVIAPLFIIAEVINLLHFQTIFQYPSILLAAQGLFYVAFSLFYFTEMLLNPIDVPLSNQSRFWLNSTLFLFYAISFLCFGLMGSLIKTKAATTILSAFIYGANITFYCFLFYSIYIETKNRVSVQQ